MSNRSAARDVIERVRAFGTIDFCICGGSRNAPLIDVLGGLESVRITTFVDERSAAFFALGRIKRDRLPVAVVTTSGTAAAELLPAAIEACYAGAPVPRNRAGRSAVISTSGAPA